MRMIVFVPVLGILLAGCSDSPTIPYDAVETPRFTLVGPEGGAPTILLSTLGSGPDGPWIGPSILVEIDPTTGETLRTIGSVGYIVNGLEYDGTTGKLFASTSIQDPSYNGLIEIDLDFDLEGMAVHFFTLSFVFFQKMCRLKPFPYFRQELV